MPVTKSDLDAFHQFAETKLAREGADSLHELVDIWEMEQAAPELHAQNVAALKAAIRDMENGDSGRPARKVIEELRDDLSRRA